MFFWTICSTITKFRNASVYEKPQFELEVTKSEVKCFRNKSVMFAAQLMHQNYMYIYKKKYVMDMSLQAFILNYFLNKYFKRWELIIAVSIRIGNIKFIFVWKAAWFFALDYSGIKYRPHVTLPSPRDNYGRLQCLSGIIASELYYEDM